MSFRESKRPAPLKPKMRSPRSDEHATDSVTPIQQTLGNAATRRSLNTDPANAADLQNRIATLQPMIGNAAVQRRLKTPMIQRGLYITSADLSGKQKGGVADNSKLSTFRGIQKNLDEFHKLGAEDHRGVDLLSDIIKKCESWLSKSSHKKAKDAQKRDSLTRLKDAAFVERRRLVIVRTLGIPQRTLDTFTPAQVSQFFDVYQAFDRGATQAAFAQFTALKPLLGEGGDLIESFMKRKQIEKINPALGAIMGNKSKPDSKSGAASDAAIKLIKDEAQVKLDRFKTLDDQFKQAVTDFNRQSAAQKAAGQAPDAPPALLKEGIPENKEYTKLKMEAPHYRNLLSGDAVKNKQSQFKDFTEAELYGVMGYTSNLYGAINTPLRAKVGTAAFTPGHTALAGSITSALQKLKPYKGEVYRHGGDFPGYWAVNQIVGAQVSDMAPLSTAVDQKGPANAAEQHEVLEILTSIAGRDVSKLSMFGGKEGEVLFAPGTHFRVVAAFERNAPAWGKEHKREQWEVRGQRDKPFFERAMAAVERDDRKNEFRRVVIKVEVG